MSWQQVIAKDIVKGRVGGSGGAKKYTNYTNEKLLADAWDDDKTDQLIADITAGGRSGYTTVIELLAPFKGKTKNEIGTMLHRDDTYGSIIDDMEDSLNLTSKELIEKIKTNLAKIATKGKGGTTIEAILSQLKESPSLENANQLRELVNNKDSIETEMNGIITNAELIAILEDLYPEQPDDKILLDARPQHHPTLQVTWGVVRVTTGKHIEGWLKLESRTKSHHSYKIINYTKDSPQAIIEEGKEIVAANEDRGYFSETLPLGLILMGEKGERETVSQEGSQDSEVEYVMPETSDLVIFNNYLEALKELTIDALLTINDTKLLPPMFFSTGRSKGYSIGLIFRKMLLGESAKPNIRGLQYILEDNIPERKLKTADGEQYYSPKLQGEEGIGKPNQLSVSFLQDIIVDYEDREHKYLPLTDDNTADIMLLKEQIAEKFGIEGIDDVIDFDIDDLVEKINNSETELDLDKVMQFAVDNEDWIEYRHWTSIEEMKIALEEKRENGEDVSALEDKIKQMEQDKSKETTPQEGLESLYDKRKALVEDGNKASQIKELDRTIERTIDRLANTKDLEPTSIRKKTAIRLAEYILLTGRPKEFIIEEVKPVLSVDLNEDTINAVIYAIENNLFDIHTDIKASNSGLNTIVKTLATIAIRFDSSIDQLVGKLDVESLTYVPKEGDSEILKKISEKIEAVFTTIAKGFEKAIKVKVEEMIKNKDSLEVLLKHNLIVAKEA